MVDFFSPSQRRRFRPSNELPERYPVPTRSISNGEFDPQPQTAAQREVEARLGALAEREARRQGIDRRTFLRSSCGMAAAFLSMNCLLYTSPSPRDRTRSRMPSSA